MKIDPSIEIVNNGEQRIFSACSQFGKLWLIPDGNKNTPYCPSSSVYSRSGIIRLI